MFPGIKALQGSWKKYALSSKILQDVLEDSWKKS